MGRQRKSYSAAFKAQVALAAIRGDCTANELAAKHGLHPTLISNWKSALLGGAESFFASGGRATAPDDRPDPAELFEQIGRLKMELEWLKKKLPDG
jgi:transposase-like protein